MPPDCNDPHVLPHYKLGEKLGQGSFGAVYRALNFNTGETVAVKQITIGHIPLQELPDIMSEIDLLKNLHHSNIVQYRGYHATPSHLYIILEYCENGSLHTILKKFGRFPEPLVALYVDQVLQGLQYLHEQGVIHRDIKGSNILANKQGGIKLADFGVATRTTSTTRDTSVVGSPYWMAPEIIDQSGATPASDIWSLGCLVIELLTGKPPYAFLDPMPALFRIVNDEEGPPIPEGASEGVRDFLQRCFQKDGNLRVGARRLLKHPWMVAARRKRVEEEEEERQRQRQSARAGAGAGGASEGVEQRGGQQRTSISTSTSTSTNQEDHEEEEEKERRPVGRSGYGGDYEETVQRVREWNAAIRPRNATSSPKPKSTSTAAAPTSAAAAALFTSSHSKIVSALQAPHSSTLPVAVVAARAHARRQHDFPPLAAASSTESRSNTNTRSSGVGVEPGDKARGGGLGVMRPTKGTGMGTGIRSLGPDGSGTASAAAVVATSASGLGRAAVTMMMTMSRSERIEEQEEEEEEEEEDVWDGDFEEGISKGKLMAALDRNSSSSSSSASSPSPTSCDSEDEDDDDDDGGGTIRPSSSSTALSPLRATPTSAAATMTPIIEDYSDLLPSPSSSSSSSSINAAVDGFEDRVKRLRDQQQRAGRGLLLRPEDLEAVLALSSPSSTEEATSSKAGGRQPLAPLAIGIARRSSLQPPRTPAGSTTGRGVLPIELYAEDEGEGDDWGELVFGVGVGVGAGSMGAQAAGAGEGGAKKGKTIAGKGGPGGGGGDENRPQQQQQGQQSLQLTQRLSSKSWLGDDDSDEEDPFFAAELSGLDEDDLGRSSAHPISAGLGQGEGQGGRRGAADHHFEAHAVAREKFARQGKVVEGLVERLGGENESDLREASLELITILEGTPEVKAHFVKSHGMLAVIEVLQVTRSREILVVLLRVVNLIVGFDPDTLEKICLVGGLPVVLSFASPKFSREIRLEAALFIGSMCRTSILTLQMFVSCRGLKALVEMMDENYAERKDLVWMAVDGISRVFEMNGPTPRNDFCRIFSHEGLLEPLSSALLSVAQDDDDLAQSAKAKIIAIFLIFAQSDKKVKEAVASRAVVLRLVKSLRLLEADHLALMLKTIKYLTMLPSALEVLQNANAIEVLVGILAQQFEGKLAAEIHNHVVNSLFNLCRLSKVRQEEAAIAGAIPILQQVVSGSSPLKQFALPILCDFAHASKTCRKLLWKHDGLNFYLTLLRDSFWSNPALEAILAWLQDETARVEECLLEATALESLLRVFCKTRSATFEALLEPFHKLLRTSPAVSTRLATSSSFFKRIVDRLSRDAAGGKAVVRLNILRITKTVFDALPLAHRDKVVKILLVPVNQLAEGDPAILVKELAKDLKKEFAKVRDEGKRSLQRRVSRRAASEGGGVSTTPSSSAGAEISAAPPGGAGSSRRGNLFGRAG